MSVIIRLQGLPWSASAMNIRHFFAGLSIPAGGVHIIGGDGGDAFIAFSSDDDARVAMKKNLCALNGTPVQLFLSSKSEMQSVIDAARSGASASVASTTPVAGNTMMAQTSMPQEQQSLQQSAQQQQRQPFQNMPNAFQAENQNQNNASAALAGQQGSGFNPQMQNQFPKNEWQGFQMYGGHGNERNQQTAGNFQLQQRVPVSQDETRFPGMQGSMEGRGQYNAMQQGKMFPGSNVQFPDNTNPLQQSGSAMMGLGGLQQKGMDMPVEGPMTQKQDFMNKQMSGRQGNVATSMGMGMDQNESQAAMQGNIGPMGRGQGVFPGQMGMGPNRDIFNNAVQGRLGPGNMQPGNIPANQNMAGPRGLMDEKSLMGRGNQIGEQPNTKGMDTMMQKEKFSDQFSAEKSNLVPDGRKKEMMQWGEETQPNARFPGNQKPFDQGVLGDAPNMSKTTPDPFPFRGDPERARMNRMADSALQSELPVEMGRNRSLGSQERDPQFPGRDMGMGGRFPGDQGQGGRFAPDRFPERPLDRFAEESLPASEDSMPSTRYPPDDEPLGAPGDLRLPGRFPTRGRPEDMRYAGDERQFPPGDRRIPSRDQGLSKDQEQFPEGSRTFPPAGRGFPPDERFPGDERHFPTDERRPMGDERRFPPGPEGRRPLLDDGRFPPEERMGVHPDRLKPDEFSGRRPGDNPFAPDDIRFREREEELRRREAFMRSRQGLDDRYPPGHPREGRPDIRPGLRDFEGDEAGRPLPPDRRFPPERGFRREEDEQEFRGRPGLLDDLRPGMSRFERDHFDPWQEGDDHYPRHGLRGPPPGNPDFPGMRRGENMEDAMDMDQRAGHEMAGRGPGFEGRRGPAFEGRGGMEGLRGPESESIRELGGRRPGMESMRGPGMDGFRGMEGRGAGMEGIRGRGIDGMRGRGMEGIRGRGFEGRGGPGPEGRPGIPSLLDDTSFDYGHGSAGRGKPMAGTPEEEISDFDNRFTGPAGRGMYDRPQRGRGDPFFNRGRPGHPYGRGRGGLDVDRRMEDAGPDGRFSMDVDARNVGGRPDAPPIRPLMGDAPPKRPDFNVVPGSGRGLLGDAPPDIEPTPKAEPEKPDTSRDSNRRDVDSRPRRSYDRDRERDRRSDDRRGRDRDDRRSGDRSERSRYRWERDRSDRRRSRSRERSSRDKDRRSRDHSSKRDHDSPKRGEPRSRSVRITNMPTNVNYKDIRKFMQPFEIPFDGLKLINDEQGQRKGEGYVQFRRSDDVSRALRRNGDKLNGQAVTVTACSEEEYSKAVDSYIPPRKETGLPAQSEKPGDAKDDKIRYIVQLKNLPLNITKQDIVQFFKGLTIDNNGEAAYIEFDNAGIATGNGFVELKSDYDYKKALTLDGTLMGTVTIRVLPGKKEEADDLKSKQQAMFQRAALRTVASARMVAARPLLQSEGTRPGMAGARPGGPQNPNPLIPTTRPTTPSAPDGSPDTVCVHIQGLPLLATPQDIREFFSDCQIAMRGINIAHDSRGKPLGEGFVEFKFKSDFEKAIKKDKTSLGRHIVAVKPIGKKEMMDRLGHSRQGGFSPQQQAPQLNQGQSTDDQRRDENKGRSQADEKQQNQPQALVMQTPQNGQSNQPGPKPLLSAPLAPANPALNPSGITMTPGGSKSIPPGVLNKNWFYVRCQNFPPDIAIAEIMHFFQGFRPIGESIRLHYSSEGKPTGNAVVGFATPDEAQRALQRLNMKVCRQNAVSLHPA